MKAKSRLLTGLGGLAVATFTRHWMSSLDLRGTYYDPVVDPVHPQFRGPVVFLFWHEYIPFLFYLRGHSNVAMLLSQHHDAEWLSQAARHMGFQTVRGSTNRGGVAALREMLRKSQNLNLAITPDGPRGPRRKLAPGPIYLASKLQIPLVAIGLGYDRPWRMPTWDRFALPRPYSRARGISSPLVCIPANLDRTGIEHYRQRVERLLNRMTEEAEQWAAAGVRYAGERPLRREGIPLARRRAAGAQLRTVAHEPPVLTPSPRRVA